MCYFIFKFSVCLSLCVCHKHNFLCYHAPETIGTTRVEVELGVSVVYRSQLWIMEALPKIDGQVKSLRAGRARMPIFKSVTVIWLYDREHIEETETEIQIQRHRYRDTETETVMNLTIPYHQLCQCKLTRNRSYPFNRGRFYSKWSRGSVLLALCAENTPVNGEFPAQRPVARSFDVFFDLCLNKQLSKQSWGWWFGSPSRPLWHHL